MCCSDFEQITKNKLLIDMKLVLTAVVFFVCFFLINEALHIMHHQGRSK